MYYLEIKKFQKLLRNWITWKSNEAYDVGVKHEKSALERFADKYVIEGKPGVVPLEYFTNNYLPSLIKDFMRNHRSIKILMIMVIEMEKNIIEKKGMISQSRWSLFLFRNSTHTEESWKDRHKRRFSGLP